MPPLLPRYRIALLIRFGRLLFNVCVSSLPSRLSLLCGPWLVHVPVDGRPRLQEGSF
jgi:hypothetical protein